MTWSFTPQDLAAAGGDFANLLMIGYNETTKVWTPVKQVSKTATSVTFEVPHFSLWAYAVRTPGVTPPAPPTATTPGTTTAPTGPAQAAPPAGAAGAGAAVPPGTVIPRPANTGTGIPAQQSGVNAVLPYALAVLGLGVAGGIALRTARRRS